MGGCKCSRTDCQACQRRRESARVRSAICRKKKKSATVPSTKISTSCQCRQEYCTECFERQFKTNAQQKWRQKQASNPAMCKTCGCDSDPDCSCDGCRERVAARSRHPKRRQNSQSTVSTSLVKKIRNSNSVNWLSSEDISVSDDPGPSDPDQRRMWLEQAMTKEHELLFGTQSTSVTIDNDMAADENIQHLVMKSLSNSSEGNVADTCDCAPHSQDDVSGRGISNMTSGHQQPVTSKLADGGESNEDLTTDYEWSEADEGDQQTEVVSDDCDGDGMYLECIDEFVDTEDIGVVDMNMRDVDVEPVGTEDLFDADVHVGTQCSQQHCSDEPIRAVQNVGTYGKRGEYARGLDAETSRRSQRCDCDLSLRPCTGECEQQRLEPLQRDGELYYKVHSFVDHRIKPGGRKQQYLVHWESYPSSFDTWVDTAQLNKDLSVKAYQMHYNSYRARMCYADNQCRPCDKEDDRPLARKVLKRHHHSVLNRCEKGFMKSMSGLFTQLLAICAFCGTATWEPKGWTIKDSLVTGKEFAIGQAANLIMQGACRPLSGGWYCCQHCNKHEHARERFLSALQPMYVRTLCDIGRDNPMQLSLLGVLSTPLTTDKWVNSYAKGSIGTTHILDSPYIAMKTLSKGWEALKLTSEIMAVHQEGTRRNPIYNYCLSMLQRGIHEITHAMVDLGVLNERALLRMEGRGLQDISAPEDAMRNFRQVGLLQNNLQFDQSLDRNTLYDVGNIQMSKSVVGRTVQVVSTITGQLVKFAGSKAVQIATAVGLSSVAPALAAGVAGAASFARLQSEGLSNTAVSLGAAAATALCLSSESGDSDQDNFTQGFTNFMRGVTLEYALMPYLFPDGRGFYLRGTGGARSLTEYLQHRMKQLLSPFTLLPPYILHMYMIRQANVLSEGVTDMVLQKALTQYMRQHPGSTMDQAIAHAIKYKIPKGICQTPRWHKEKLDDLIAMVKKWGMPSLFLTLTAGDKATNDGHQWTEVQDLETALKKFCKGYTWRDAPAENAVLFHRRVKQFMQHYICQKSSSGAIRSGLLGRVLHYVIRYEVQMRGSLHAHILLWVHEDDVDGISDEIVACVPGIWIAGTHWYPHDGATKREEELLRLVTQNQIHHCLANYCLKRDGVCSKKFPFKPHHTKTEFDKDKRCFVYYRPGEEHSRVVPYHPAVLLAWGAHMNIQRVCNAAWSRYMLKYAVKAEPPTDITMDGSSAERLGLKGSKEMLTLISNMIVSRVIQPCEAAAIMGGIKMFKASTNVVAFSTAPPKWRVRRVVPGAQGVLLAAVDKYCQRPSGIIEDIDFDNLTLYQYFTKYTADTDKRKGHVIAQDMLGRWVQHRRDDQPIRFTSYSPTSGREGFFYNVLLKHVPFRDEASLMSVDNPTQSYLWECWKRGIVTGEEDVERLVREYCDDNLLQETTETKVFQQVMQDLMDAQNEDGRDVRDVADEDAALQAAMEEELRYIEQQESNSEQRKVIEAIQNQQTGLCILSGPPGTGKTWLTKKLIHSLRQSGKKVMVTATTGAAATRLSKFASTVHSALAIPLEGSYFPSLSVLSPKRRNIEAADVIIIDEMSMMSRQVFQFVLYRLVQCMGVSDWDGILQNKLIILVGDMHQLPPVCYCKDISQDNYCRRCHLSSHPLVALPNPLVHKFTLSEPMRQAADPLYVKFLSLIRVRRPTQKEIDDIFEDRFIIEPHEAIALANASTRVLCTNRVPSIEMNTAMLHKAVTSQVHNVGVLSNTGGDSNSGEWLRNSTFHTLTQVAVGARVMLTCNGGAVAPGSVNGSCGTVVGLEYGPVPDKYKYPGQSATALMTVLVRMDDTGQVQAIRRTKYGSLFVTERHVFCKATFPLQLAYAITGHKSQGATLNGTTIIDINSTFCPGLLYVMLSRVTEREQIRLLQRLTPEMFTPMDIPF